MKRYENRHSRGSGSRWEEGVPQGAGEGEGPKDFLEFVSLGCKLLQQSTSSQYRNVLELWCHEGKGGRGQKEMGEMDLNLSG